MRARAEPFSRAEPKGDSRSVSPAEDPFAGAPTSTSASGRTGSDTFLPLPSGPRSPGLGQEYGHRGSRDHVPDGGRVEFAWLEYRGLHRAEGRSGANPSLELRTGCAGQLVAQRHDGIADQPDRLA